MMRVVLALALVLSTGLPVHGSQVLHVFEDAVSDLAAHYRVATPWVTIYSAGEHSPAYYKRSSQTIYIYQGFAAIYDALPLADDSIWVEVLRHVATHEFAHHLQTLRGDPINEPDANVFSSDWTGWNHKHMGDLMLSAICLSGYGGDPLVAEMEAVLRAGRPDWPDC